MKKSGMVFHKDTSPCVLKAGWLICPLIQSLQIVTFKQSLYIITDTNTSLNTINLTLAFFFLHTLFPGGFSFRSVPGDLSIPLHPYWSLRRALWVQPIKRKRKWKRKAIQNKDETTFPILRLKQFWRVYEKYPKKSVLHENQYLDTEVCHSCLAQRLWIVLSPQFAPRKSLALAVSCGRGCCEHLVPLGPDRHQRQQKKSRAILPRYFSKFETPQWFHTTGAHSTGCSEPALAILRHLFLCAVPHLPASIHPLLK